MFTKKQITSGIKITVLSAILIVGLNYANAAWSGPTANPPSGGIPTPVNVSSINQVKNGGLGVNALSVFGDGLFSRDMTANEFCFSDGKCITSWSQLQSTSTPQAPTVSLSSSPTSIAYGGSSTLTWSSINATSCSANWTSSTATSGTATKSNLTSSQTYTMACTGAGGSAQGSATVTVGSAPPPPPPPPPCTEQTYYLDSDKDGYGAGSAVDSSCDIPAGYSTVNTDCAPIDSTKWRNETLHPDRDGDGYYSVKGETICVGSSVSVPGYQYGSGNDCYDGNALAHPYGRPPYPNYFTSDRGDGSFDYDCSGYITRQVGTVNAVASQTIPPYILGDYANGYGCYGNIITYNRCTTGASFLPSCGSSFSFCGSIQSGPIYSDSQCTQPMGTLDQYGYYVWNGASSFTQGCF
ncbi:hypothetical protein KJ991_02355 [Patescibacteria group bacterium]|nr:hypothetical protein [Patescibacteria group bacterium]MBU4057459.1 hypothetical protein [Patescibacteria group bacterium]MBU4115630.1 hypothetical protein [Patescibacteria group bacterium]